MNQQAQKLLLQKYDHEWIITILWSMIITINNNHPIAVAWRKLTYKPNNNSMIGWQCTCNDKNDCEHIYAALNIIRNNSREKAHELFFSKYNDENNIQSMLYPNEPWLYDPYCLAEVIEWWFNEAQNHIMVGQEHDYLQWTSTIKETFNITNNELLMEAFNILKTEEKIDLDFNIIKPFQEMKELYEYGEEKYQHKRINFTDFGHWHCSYCNQSGDEYTDPRTVNCNKK